MVGHTDSGVLIVLVVCLLWSYWMYLTNFGLKRNNYCSGNSGTCTTTAINLLAKSVIV